VAQTYFNKTIDINGQADPGGLIIVDGDSIFMAAQTRVGIYFYLAFLKIDHNGDTLWKKLYGNNGEYFYVGYSGSFRKTKDGNLLFCGTHKLDGEAGNYYLMKLNLFADTLWTAEYGGTENNGALSLCEAEDSTIWVSGFSQATGQNANIPVLQFSKTGALLWDTIYGGNGNDAIYSIETTLDGGFILGGESDSYGDGSDDIYVMKLNSKGVLEWDATFGNEKNDAGRVHQMETGEYIVTGGMVPSGKTNSQAYIAKLNENGNLLWEKFYSYDDQYHDVFGVTTIFDKNGNMTLAGHTYDRSGLNRPLGWLVKLNANGDSLWTRKLRIRDRDHYLVDMKQTNDGGFILGGYVFSSSTGGDTQDLWVIKVDSMGCDVAHCVTGINNTLGASWGSVSVYPNPAFDYLTFDIDYSLYNNPEVMLYDSFGKLVLKQKLNNSVTTIDISLLQKGVYFYQFIADGEQLSTEKIVKL
jgi:hypothetical protein